MSDNQQNFNLDEFIDIVQEIVNLQNILPEKEYMLKIQAALYLKTFMEYWEKLFGEEKLKLKETEGFKRRTFFWLTSLGLEIEERKEINCGNITHLEDTFKIIPFKKLQNNQLKEILENLLEVINNLFLA